MHPAGLSHSGSRHAATSLATRRTLGRTARGNTAWEIVRDDGMEP
jgi:hypothetical protein